MNYHTKTETLQYGTHEEWLHNKFSHPRYTRIKCDEDFATLPRLEKEYLVNIDEFEDSGVRIAKIEARILPRGPISIRLRFMGPKGDKRGIYHLCHAGIIPLEQVKVLAARHVENRLSNGIPKRPPRIRGDANLEDVLAVYDSLQKASPDHKRQRQRLFDEFLSSYMQKPTSALRRDKTTNLIDTASLFDPLKAEKLFKHLGAFLKWAVTVGVIKSYPLAKYKPYRPERNRPKLKVQDLARIYHCAKGMGGHWQAILGISMMTFAPVEQICTAMAEDVNLENKEWWSSSMNDTRHDNQPGTHGVYLNGFARSILESYREVTGFLFPSSRTHRNNMPSVFRESLAISWRSELTQKLRERSGIVGNWNLRDIREACIVASGRRKASAIMIRDEPWEKRKALNELTEKWGAAFSRAVEDWRPPLPQLDLEDEVIL